MLHEKLLSDLDHFLDDRHGSPVLAAGIRTGKSELSARGSMLSVGSDVIGYRFEVVDEAMLRAADPGEADRAGWRHGELVHWIDDDEDLWPSVCTSTLDTTTRKKSGVLSARRI